MIPLSTAQSIIARLLSLAHAAGSKPLCVVVVDAGGVPVAMAREDGAGVSRPKLAMEKAEGALALSMPTRTLAEFYAADPAMHAILREATGKSLLPLAGGVLIKAVDSGILGALGVTGGALEQEESFAIAAIHHVGLLSDPPPDPLTTPPIDSL
jgi:uncharacterized protein GlcG (DUF336 family)